MEKTGHHTITSLHKDDLRAALEDRDTGSLPEEIARRINALSDEEMDFIASKMADAFCDCCYWESLQTIFEAHFGSSSDAAF